MMEKNKRKRISKYIQVFLTGLCFMILLAVLVFRRPRGLTMVFLDVGQGDGIYLETETGQHLFLDGGSSSKTKVGENTILPFLKSQGVNHMDYWLVSHPDQDHINGMAELLEEGYRIDHLILPGISFEDEAYQELEELAGFYQTEISYMNQKDTLTDGKLCLTCLHPNRNFWTDTANDYSMVLYLEYGYFHALFTGDIGEEQEELVVKAWEENRSDRKDCSETRLTVLKTAHHGSKYATSEKFLRVFRPQYAVISCGKENSYGHPAGEVLDRLQSCGCKIYETMEDGAVTFWTNGKDITLDVYNRFQ